MQRIVLLFLLLINFSFTTLPTNARKISRGEVFTYEVIVKPGEVYNNFKFPVGTKIRF